MNKEFNQILEQLGFYFNPDNILKHQYVSKSDLLELMERSFNLGLEVAAYYAEADYNILDYGEKPRGSNVECYVLKQSILKFKL